MKRWKKWLLYTALFFFVLLVFLFILFCTLIANPFEKDYENNLLHIIPESDFFIYAPNLEEIWNKGKKLFPLKDLQQTKGFSRFSQTREYRQLIREWQNLKKQEKQSGLLFLQEEYLWKIVKGEMAIAVKIKDKKPIFLVAMRIDFFVRIAEGAGGYFLPENIAKKYKIDMEKAIKSAVFSGQKTFFALQKDVIIFSNDPDYIQDSWRLLQNNSDSAWSSKTVQSCFAEQKPLMFFTKGKTVTSLINTNSEIATNLYPLFDINNIENTVATISLGSSSIDIQIKTYLDFTNVSSYHQKIYQKNSQGFATEILPIDTYIFTQIPIDELMINEVYKILPRNAKAEWDKRLGWLNNNYGTTDFLKERVFNYLDGEIVVACRRIDYIRENIDVIDPYPAISLFAKTKAAQELYDSLKGIMEKEIAKTDGKVRVEEKLYGTHKFLFLNVGGFDFTGGAIQPVFGTINDYVVFTTNISFFRLLVDVQDKIAQSWDKSALYKMKETSLSSGVVQVTISGEGILTFIEDFKSSWAEAIALSRFNKNPRGRTMEYYKQNTLREWQLYLDYANSMDVDIFLEIQPTIEFIEINSSIFFDIKKK